MSIAHIWRRLALAVLTGLAVAIISFTVPIGMGALTPANAQPAMVQGTEEFEIALEPYGAWHKHPRFGEVWVPAARPRDWRPYEYGHWVYTDEWGWYWVPDDAEEDWGWVTYHYGRWAFERRLGWFWVPGDEWAPAWVDWRHGGDTIGWSALPPDELIEAYEAEPALWIFVPSRFMTAPRLRAYIVPPQRRALALRSTRLVNRTLRVQGARMAVNPGISPAFIAAVTRAALPAYRVRPRVFGATQGVSGAVQVRREDLRAGRGPGGAGQRGGNRANAVSVQRTTTIIRPAASTPAPQALGKDERGRLGSHPPRAAQGAATPQQQQQQAPQSQAPANVAPRPAPQGGAPATAPVTTPPPPASTAPARQEPPPRAGQQNRRDERRAPQPPANVAPAGRQGEPAPQAKPTRPIVPQTPPPPAPAQSGSKQAPAAARPPPPHPVPPAVKRVEPPKPPQANKPPEAKKPPAPKKPDGKPEKPEEKK